MRWLCVRRLQMCGREHSRPTEHLQFVRDQRERIRTSAAFLPAQQGPPQMPRCSVPRCPTEQADWTHWLIQHKRARNLPTMLSPGYKANALLLKNMASQYSPSCHLYLMKRKSYRQVSSTGQRKKGQSHQQLQANSIPAHWPEVKGFFSSQVHMGWEGTLGKLDDVHPPYPQRKTCSEFYYNTQAFCFHTSFQH
nr:uncharacterized protein LOC105863362 isoform X7 [Microcebus murinus]